MYVTLCPIVFVALYDFSMPKQMTKVSLFKSGILVFGKRIAATSKNNQNRLIWELSRKAAINSVERYS